MAEDMDRAVEVVLRGYAAHNAGDLDKAAELLHPDVVFNRVSDVEAPIEGAAGVRENMEPDVWESEHLEIHGTEVVGDCVLADVTFTARGSGSGIELNDRAWHLWRIKDGKGVEFRHFNDRDEALKAARG